MSFISKIFGGGAGNLVKSVGSTAKIFVGDKSKRDEALHAENIAVNNQFASEFQGRGKRNWFDSVIDGLNRLPRPLITFSVLGFFPYCIWLLFNHTKEYSLLMEGLTLIPVGMWSLFSIVVCFFFGGRMQMSGKDFKVDTKRLARFETKVERYNAEKEAEEDAMSEVDADENQTLKEFMQSRREPVI